MKCEICNSLKLKYHFTKHFQETHIREILPLSDYYRCEDCGFVVSKTLLEMPTSEWERLNHVFHSTLEKTSRVTLLDQPPYIHQIQMLHILSDRGIISLDRALDFAAGYGNMVRLLKKYYGKSLMLFDPYMQNDDGDVVYVPESSLDVYDTVYTSAFFEHSTRRAYLDQANSLVGDDGAMFVYTHVADEVPSDPDWFYLDPVHSFFHTRRSMELLMQQWGYESSLYCIPAQTWCLFKKHKRAIYEAVNTVNTEFQQMYLCYDKGFAIPS